MVAVGGLVTLVVAVATRAGEPGCWGEKVQAQGIERRAKFHGSYYRAGMNFCGEIEEEIKVLDNGDFFDMQLRLRALEGRRIYGRNLVGIPHWS